MKNAAKLAVALLLIAMLFVACGNNPTENNPQPNQITTYTTEENTTDRPATEPATNAEASLSPEAKAVIAKFQPVFINADNYQDYITEVRGGLYEFIPSFVTGASGDKFLLQIHISEYRKDITIDIHQDFENIITIQKGLAPLDKFDRIFANDSLLFVQVNSQAFMDFYMHYYDLKVFSLTMYGNLPPSIRTSAEGIAGRIPNAFEGETNYEKNERAQKIYDEILNTFNLLKSGQ